MKIKERGNRILTGETTISKKFRYILLLMCVCIVFWLSALQVRAAAPVLSAKNLSVTVGHTRTLKLQNVSGKVTWSSSNAKTAVVSSTGTVTGRRAGSCVITAKYRGKAYQCMVKVYRTGIEWMPNYLQKKKRTCQKPGTCGSGRQFLHRVLDQCIHGVCSVENGQQRNRRFNNTGLDDTVREADRELQTISGSRIRWVQRYCRRKKRKGYGGSGLPAFETAENKASGCADLLYFHCAVDQTMESVEGESNLQ